MTPSNNRELQLPRGEADLLLLAVKVGEEEEVEEVGETFKESGEGGGVNNCLFVYYMSNRVFLCNKYLFYLSFLI